MTAFVRRFRELPSLEDLTAIEQLAIIDRNPRTPVVGVGSGTLLIVGEFEDGDFETPTEVFGETDEFTKFGGFGYTYGSLTHQNPCARLHLTENWNGNGYIKGKYLKPKRKVICRVDTSVGDVRFTLAAGMRTDPAPFNLANADQLSVTTDAGGPGNCTAVAAAVATITGGGFAASGYVGGEQIGIQIDDLPEVIISFQVGDQTRAQVATRINGFMGYVCASDTGAALKIDGIQLGSGGQVVLRDVTDPIGDTTLIAIGHASGTTAGTGNVANAAAVTAAEVAALINVAAITGISGAAVVDAITQEVVIYRTGSSSGTVRVDDVAGAMATDLGLTTGATGLVTANIGAAFTVPAGTRVRNAGADEWVTMRTISWPEGTVASPNDGTQDVEIRDGTDDGSGTGSGAGLITTIVDIPDRMIEVTNPGNVSVALTENQIDAAYATAFDATKDIGTVAKDVTAMVSARRSTICVQNGSQNAIDASDDGCQGRVFYTRSPLGYTSTQAIADVANYRSDRIAYSWLGWQIYVSEIAEVGTAGGTGFTADGIITVGADGPLAYLACRMNPEENLGQNTGLLTFTVGLEETTEELNRTLYTALKAAGIMSPRIDQNDNPIYQSDVTSSLEAGRTTLKRRRMADYIQDSCAKIGIPYSKKLAKSARRRGFLLALDGFLSGLKSETDENNQRISDYAIVDSSDENPDYVALGIFTFKIQVQMLSSMDTIIFDTEIGEGVSIATGS